MAKINFDPQSPVIAVDITLEGKGGIKRRIKVALDTGATYTMIPWEIIVCHDLPPKSYVTGLLGSSFLRHFKITIDYPEGMLEISR
jgi:hypothetical protein